MDEEKAPRYERGLSDPSTACPACNGTGRACRTVPCTACGGTGLRKTQEERFGWIHPHDVSPSSLSTPRSNLVTVSATFTTSEFHAVKAILYAENSRSSITGRNDDPTVSGVLRLLKAFVDVEEKL